MPARLALPLAFATLFGAATPCFAVFFQQNVDDSGGAFGFVSGLDQEVQVADDFVLDQTETVTHVTWWGRYATTDPADDNFRIRFFEEAGAGDSPVTAPVLAEFVPSRVARALAGFTVEIGGTFDFPTPRVIEVYQYTAELELNGQLGIELDAGETFYLSILNDVENEPIVSANPAANDDWFWLQSNEGQVVSSWFRPSGPNAAGDTQPWASVPAEFGGNMAFVLIPEPAATLLFAAAGLLLLRRPNAARA